MPIHDDDQDEDIDDMDSGTDRRNFDSIGQTREMKSKPTKAN